MDIAREQQVNTSVKSLNVTRIIVAHRPETIASANRVIVLAGGKVVKDAAVSQLPVQPDSPVPTKTTANSPAYKMSFGSMPNML